MARSTNWTFTLNNYTNEDVEKLQKMQACGYCRSVLAGKEKGESGTPHLQGFIIFFTKKSLKQLKKLIPRAHVEIMKGSIGQNIDYCSKDGVVLTFGTHPKTQKEKGEKEKERWLKINALCKEGKLEELEQEYPQVWNRYYRNCKLIAADHAPTPSVVDENAHEWYYGTTGTGKSLKARTENPDAYIKLNNKWWDGYSGEETVIIDDLDKYDVKLGGHLKRWSDHYPFPAEYKGGVKKIRPKKIIVTSNYTPEEIWDDERTIGPLRRRFKVICFNDHPFNPHKKPKE